jgi:hypothetical protein
MHPWTRSRLLYVPGLALAVAGFVVLLTTPLFTPVNCTCSTGPGPGPVTCPPCPAGFAWHPAGIELLVAAGGYAAIVFAMRHRGRSRAPGGPGGVPPV